MYEKERTFIQTLEELNNGSDEKKQRRHFGSSKRNGKLRGDSSGKTRKKTIQDIF